MTIINEDLANLVGGVNADDDERNELDIQLIPKFVRAKSAGITAIQLGYDTYNVVARPIRRLKQRYNKAQYAVIARQAEQIASNCPDCSDATRKYFEFATRTDFCHKHTDLYHYTKYR